MVGACRGIAGGCSGFAMVRDPAQWRFCPQAAEPTTEQQEAVQVERGEMPRPSLEPPVIKGPAQEESDEISESV